MNRRVGRPVDMVCLAWSLRFNYSKHAPRRITARLCWQLCQCRSDEARRLILGSKEKDDA
jgi:hypothetical protein